jgi:dipeptidase E
MIKMRIIAVGGGAWDSTVSIDDEFLGQINQAGPVLFIPTASSDNPDTIERFDRWTASRGVSGEVLRLHSGEEAAPKIERAAAIYVGGGNTKMMVALWKELGVDRLLQTFAIDEGRPVGGVSAGAICWFRVGNSDWPVYEGIPGVNTAPVAGLGWVDLAYCPHVHAEPFRYDEFNALMATEPGVGIGVTDGAAMQIIDDTYRILASTEEGHAYRVEAGIAVRIDPHADFRPLSSLYTS